MSEAFKCYMCGGDGYHVLFNSEDPDEIGPQRTVECARCRGSGGLNLRCVGPGFVETDPPWNDPYVAVPKGVHWR